MVFRTFGTGSKGNAYALMADNKVLLIECGLPFMEVARGLNYQVSNIVGAIVTHEHGDHSKYIEQYKNMGIPIFAPYIEKKPIVFSKDFYIQYFDLPHDGTENYGFLISWNGQRILYMTDFEYCKYKFKNINHIIIECNYQEKYIDAEAMNFEHKIRGHASLNTCKEFIRENASKSLRTAVIVHLSDKTCVPKEIVEEVKTVARFANTVCCAVSGSDVELQETDCPF